MEKLEKIISDFQSLDFDFRLDLLLDYAEKLPQLPKKYQTAKDAGLNRVPECQTAVYLWADVENGKVQIFADVSEEAPTVRGFISILVASINGILPSEIENIPNDLLFKLGLGQHVGMVRVQGLSSIIPRIKNEVKKLIESESVS